MKSERIYAIGLALYWSTALVTGLGGRSTEQALCDTRHRLERKGSREALRRTNSLRESG
jgi:hypothetical protein